MNEYQLRKAEEKDARQLFDWRNDPEVRRNSFHSEPVLWEEHIHWFHRMMADPDQRQYILERKTERTDSCSVPVGQIRIRRMAQSCLAEDGAEGTGSESGGANLTGAMQHDTGAGRPHASFWEISYSISSDFRGQGLGTRIVLLLETAIRREQLPVSVLVARVKPENLPSCKVFVHAGYRQELDRETKDTKITYIEFQKAIG